MNKDQELAILAEAATKLGNASYLGGWLKAIASELERDLRSDIIPVITLAEARQQAEYILATAHNNAERHHNQIKSYADQLLTDAKAESARVLAAAKKALLSAVDSL